MGSDRNNCTNRHACTSEIHNKVPPPFSALRHTVTQSQFTFTQSEHTLSHTHRKQATYSGATTCGQPCRGSIRAHACEASQLLIADFRCRHCASIDTAPLATPPLLQQQLCVHACRLPGTSEGGSLSPRPIGLLHARFHDRLLRWPLGRLLCGRLGLRREAFPYACRRHCKRTSLANNVSMASSLTLVRVRHCTLAGL